MATFFRGEVRSELWSEFLTAAARSPFRFQIEV